MLNVFPGELGEPFLHKGRGILGVSPNADGGASGEHHLQHDLHQLIQPGSVCQGAQIVIVDLLSYLLALCVHVDPSIIQRLQDGWSDW